MLTRIAVVSSPGEDLEKIRASIRNPMKYTVREFLSMDAVLAGLASFPMEILLLRCAKFEDRHVEMAIRAGRRFPSAVVMALAKHVEPMARVKSMKLERFRLLQEPLEVSDLAAIIDKHRSGCASAQRLHPRARREQEVQVHDSKGRVHRGRFLDFAQMGARISVPSFYKLEPKESVQIVYNSSTDSGRLHRIESKVVWAESSGGLVDQLMGVKQQTAGFRFIAAY